MDYRTRPEGQAGLDCSAPSAVLREVVPAALTCLASLQSATKSGELRYRLRREPAPYWELEVDEDETPACARTSLARIPVPREIVFQSPELGRDTRILDCFSARIDIDADRVLGVRLPLAKLGMTIPFPSEALARAVTSDAEFEAQLLTWSIAPFWSGEAGTRAIRARIVPLPLCSRCLGERGLVPVSATGNLPALWP